MILEIQSTTPPSKTSALPLQFISMQLIPLADGVISVALKSTAFDEEELELIDEDIVDGRVTSLEQIFDLIRSHVRIADGPIESNPGQPI
jgi:hypothetical protein